jgi:hypothetical protein
MRDDCSVIVASCDAYGDVLGHFAALKLKFWPDCPFETVLVTETAPPAPSAAFDRIVACGGGSNWAQRLVAALDIVETPYVLMLCDDYLLEAPVDTPQVLHRVAQARELDAANLRLIPNPRRGAPRDDGLMEYPKNTAYCISTLAGIWNREFLQGLARGAASIWEFERYGSFVVGGERRALLATRTKEFPFVDAVHKGHWEEAGVRVCRENGLEVDLARRGLPPASVRVVEALKAFVFAVVPNTLIVRVQNALGAGARERGAGGGA